ncbi:hypothetical protein [uncultured Pseudoalteromonas sp.]|uniref:hypothetical protein n=2 Tax=uncultured Pseudoalteromonas sp. TaxID=114053 RepID=UPI0026247F9B|nr:hypothetical protein [uncultured Pseudoalteromonas sp.]
MMTNLTWTKKKPTLPGHYWFRMLDTAFSVQEPHVRQVVILDDELFITDPDTHPVSELSDDFEFAGPIDLPEEPVVTAKKTKPFESGYTSPGLDNREQNLVALKLIKNNRALFEELSTLDAREVLEKASFWLTCLAGVNASSFDEIDLASREFAKNYDL